jgi:hypothetical protein
MKEKTKLSIQIYFIVSIIMSISCIFYLILPRTLLLISNEKTTVLIEVLHRDFEYGDNYIEYSYKNKFNNIKYTIKKSLDYDQYISLKGKKNIDIYYGKFLPKYTVIEILGDSDYKVGIFVLLLILLTFWYGKIKKSKGNI